MQALVKLSTQLKIVLLLLLLRLLQSCERGNWSKSEGTNSPACPMQINTRYRTRGVGGEADADYALVAVN